MKDNYFSRRAQNVALQLLCLLLCACGGGGGSGAPPTPPAQPLSVSPAAVTIGAGTTTTFSASGGGTPYTFSVASGIGSINPASGTYIAPNAAGSATIRVTDASGAVITASVQVNPALRMSPSAITMTAASGYTYAFAATDGVPPYRYAVVGAGSIDALGNYTAGDTPGRTTIEVRDAQGTLVTATADLMRVRTNGIVRAAATDNTYWYLGGDFTSVNPHLAAGMIALQSASGDPQLACNLKNGFDGEVRAIVSNGVSIYVGGDFTTYQGLPANRIAKIDAATCQLDGAFSQSSGPDGNVYALALSGNTLFVGGEFAAYRGANAANIAKVDAQSGALNLAFATAVRLSGRVTSLTTVASSLLIGGDFVALNDVNQGALLKVAIANGALDPVFNREFTVDGFVDSVAVDGDSLYVVGTIYSYGQTAVGHIAKVSITSGDVDVTFSRDDGDGFDQPTTAVAVAADGVYVSGDHSNYRGSQVGLLVKLNKTTGDLNANFENAATFDGRIDSLAILGAQLYLGGLFQSINTIPAHGLAKLDAHSGVLDTAFTRPTGFDQTSFVADRSVRVMTLMGNTLLVGGNFRTYRGTLANHLAKVTIANNVPDTAFHQSAGANGAVYALLLSNSSLFVGGAFNTYRGVLVGNLVKVSASTGAADAAFNQGLGVYGDLVTTLTMNGSSLYCGGAFRYYRSESTLPAIKVDATTGVRDNGFIPIFTFINLVSVLTSVGNQIAVSGDINAVPMMINAQTGAPNPVSGTRTAFGTVRDIVADGSSLFVAGQIPYYGTVQNATPENGVIKINPLTGQLDTNFLWGHPVISGFDQLEARAIAVEGTSLFVGSHFVSAQGIYQYGVIKLDKNSGSLVPAFANTIRTLGQIEKVVPAANALWISGDFTSYNGRSAYYFVPLNSVTGELLDP